MKTEKRYWAPIESRFGKFAAWVDGEGSLLRFHLRLKGAEHVDRYAERNDRALKDVQKQITQYDAGKRRDFEFTRDMEGTSFQHEIWEALVRIPYGETTSYGALAKKLGYPNGARAVGLANGSNPIGLIVPCHRVIGADGSLTGYGGGLPLKRALLEHEARVAGVPLDLFAS
jgi:methylated-DNA-[protein]-cysteine S-methyltransferase